jgi:hypothetical protein
LQADEQQIDAKIIENVTPGNPNPNPAPVPESSNQQSSPAAISLPIILAITGGVFVIAIAGFMLIRRKSNNNRDQGNLPPPNHHFVDTVSSSLPRPLDEVLSVTLPKPAPFEPLFQNPTVLPTPLDRRASLVSNQSIGNEKTGLLHRYSDIFTEDVMSETSSVDRHPSMYQRDVTQNLANAALRMATDDSSKHTSVFSDSNYSTSTYSQRDSQFTTGTFEFSEVSDYAEYFAANSIAEESELAEAAIQMIHRNRDAMRDSRDSFTSL